VKLEWRPVSIGDGPPISTSLTLSEAKALRRLAKGKVVLEVGSAYGFSTVTMAQVAGHVDAVDPHIALNSLNQIIHNLSQYPGTADKVTLKLNYSEDVLPWLQDDSYDLAFIDGDHAEMWAAHDIQHALRLVRPGGVIAVHDYGEDTCPAVQGVCDALLPDGTLTDTLWVWTKPEE